MENYQIELTEAGRENIEETINCLVESAKAIAESSEADFETIKEKKWYKRLWEVITFSKDNQKIQARGVSNLAKLNEITMKAIVILSKYSAETAAIVSESVQKIENLENCFGQLASGMKKIALEVKSLKYNYKKSLSIQDLNVTDRDIVGSIFFKYVKSCLADGIKPNEYSQKFYSYAMEGDTPEDDISVETHLDLLSNDVQQLLYRLNQSYYYLIKGEFDDSDYFDDFDISRKNIKVIKEQIENAVLLMGAENYSSSLLPEDELYYIDESDIEFTLIPDEEQEVMELAEVSENFDVSLEEFMKLSEVSEKFDTSIDELMAMIEVGKKIGISIDDTINEIMKQNDKDELKELMTFYNISYVFSGLADELDADEEQEAMELAEVSENFDVSLEEFMKLSEASEKYDVSLDEFMKLSEVSEKFDTSIDELMEMIEDGKKIGVSIDDTINDIMKLNDKDELNELMALYKLSDAFSGLSDAFSGLADELSDIFEE